MSSNELVQRFLEATSTGTFYCREKKPQTTVLGLLRGMFEDFTRRLTFEKLMEEQTVEVLARTNDWGVLRSMLACADVGSHLEQLIKERMEEVYEVTVSTITDADSIPEWLQMSMEGYIDRTIWPNWLDITTLVRRLKEIQ